MTGCGRHHRLGNGGCSLGTSVPVGYLILRPRLRLPIDFGIRVDEIVEGITVLPGCEHDVTAFRKFDAVLVMCSKKVLPS